MRAINFRVWAINDQKMLPIQSLYTSKDGIIRKVVVIGRVRNSRAANSIYGGTTDHLSAPNFDLMQLTGLKDKNGKEIYEGDILSFGKNQRPFEMFWLNNAAAWMTRPIKTYPGDWADSEVIGNIYENPELLS